ncbi:phenoloxidase-activating factor 2-like [Topomyia yanbarensis]|uniref:phenoloxidase-activating factor 2-like n=1 Tax=Topomyia yanbarensis TaxID=2498891 RepID=UPI00273C0DEB|nr:phenoloxidase-activating factor 2-like [Topomyia yanbarensis]
MEQRTSKLLVILLLVQGLIKVVHNQCDGVCVPMGKCPANDFGGAFVFDVRVGADEEIEADCNHYLEVCCDKDAVTQEVVTIPSAGRGSGTVIKESVDQTVNSATTEFRECGFRNIDGAGFRITNANNGETEFGEFPWMVALFSQDNEGADKTYFCGGSLIKPNIVLTAAHCIINRLEKILVVRAGEWDTKTEFEVLPYQEQRVAQAIIHNNYNAQFLFNDVALLVLEQAFVADENVQLLCPPPQGIEFNDENCVATGWGKDKFDSVSYQVIMKKVELPIVSNADCQTALRATRLGRSFRLHNSFICAGGMEGIDTCTGDGGSPLVCPIPNEVNRYYQAGIVAWGIGCAQDSVPGVYVKVSLYSDWIEEQLGNLITNL